MCRTALLVLMPSGSCLELTSYGSWHVLMSSGSCLGLTSYGSWHVLISSGSFLGLTSHGSWLVLMSSGSLLGIFVGNLGSCLCLVDFCSHLYCGVSFRTYIFYKSWFIGYLCLLDHISYSFVCVCVVVLLLLLFLLLLLLLLLFCFYKLLFIFSTTWYLAGDRRHMFTKDILETRVCIIQG